MGSWTPSTLSAGPLPPLCRPLLAWWCARRGNSGPRACRSGLPEAQAPHRHVDGDAAMHLAGPVAGGRPRGGRRPAAANAADAVDRGGGGRRACACSRSLDALAAQVRQPGSVAPSCRRRGRPADHGPPRAAGIRAGADGSARSSRCCTRASARGRAGAAAPGSDRGAARRGLGTAAGGRGDSVAVRRGGRPPPGGAGGEPVVDAAGLGPADAAADARLGGTRARRRVVGAACNRTVWPGVGLEREASCSVTFSAG